MSNASAFNVDKDKMLAQALFVLSRLGGSADLHRLVKIMYHAERNHLSIYGRPITGDAFHAMDFGPVPSYFYDLFKIVRGERMPTPALAHHRFFTNKGWNTVASANMPDMDELSESDIECLVRAISEVEEADFSKRTALSHDTAWDKAFYKKPSSRIEWSDMLDAAGSNQEMKDYVLSQIEYQNLFLNK